MLFDFYGELLTGRQKNVMEYYYNDNFSFSEIAEALCVSRQAVYDALHKAEKSLRNYENKLGLMQKLEKNMSDIKEAEAAVDAIIGEYSDDEKLVSKLISVKEILNKMEE